MSYYQWFECTLLKIFAAVRLILLMIKFSHCGMWDLSIDPCDQRRNLLFENVIGEFVQDYYPE